jgi:hypothetical protein
VFGRNVGSKRNSSVGNSSNLRLRKRGSIGSSQGESIDEGPVDFELGGIFSPPSKPIKRNRTDVQRSRTVVKKQKSSSKRRERDDIFIGSNVADLNLVPQISTEEPSFLQQEPEHYHSIVLENHMKRNEKQSLQNFIKE